MISQVMLEEGTRIDAETALNFGLVAEVVDPDQVIERARQVARTWAAERKPRQILRQGLVQRLTAVNLQESMAIGRHMSMDASLLESMVKRAAAKGDAKQAWWSWRLMTEAALRLLLSRTRSCLRS